MSAQVVAGFAALIVIVGLAALGASRRRRATAGPARDPAAPAIRPALAWSGIVLLAIPGLAALALLLTLSFRH